MEVVAVALIAAGAWLVWRWRSKSTGGAPSSTGGNADVVGRALAAETDPARLRAMAHALAEQGDKSSAARLDAKADDIEKHAPQGGNPIIEGAVPTAGVDLRGRITR